MAGGTRLRGAHTAARLPSGAAPRLRRAAMPPPTLPPLCIPESAAAAAAAADAESDANLGAAPGGAGAKARSGRTAALFTEISALFAAQRAAGVDACAAQDAASYARLDAGLRALLAAYCADPAADWDRCGRGAEARAGRRRMLSLIAAFAAPARASYAFWGADHYIRNLVAVEEGVFELMARHRSAARGATHRSGVLSRVRLAALTPPLSRPARARRSSAGVPARSAACTTTARHTGAPL